MPFNYFKKLKFTFKEQREFENIDSEIAKLESQLSGLEKQLLDEASNYIKLQESIVKKQKLEEQLEEKMERWVYLHDLEEKIATDIS